MQTVLAGLLHAWHRTPAHLWALRRTSCLRDILKSHLIMVDFEFMKRYTLNTSEKYQLLNERFVLTLQNATVARLAWTYIRVCRAWAGVRGTGWGSPYSYRSAKVQICRNYSFIHSGYFYSASSSPLLLRSAPDTAEILCRSFTPKRNG